MNISKLRFYKDIETASFSRADFREYRTSNFYGSNFSEDYLLEFGKNENIDMFIGIFSTKELDAFLRNHFNLRKSDMKANNISYEFYWMYKITLTSNLVPIIEYNKDLARFINQDNEIINCLWNNLLILQAKIIKLLQWDSEKSEEHLLHQLSEEHALLITETINNLIGSSIEHLSQLTMQNIDYLLCNISNKQLRCVRYKNISEVPNIKNFFLSDINKVISYETSGFHNRFINDFLKNKYSKEEQSKENVLKALQLTKNPVCRWPDHFNLNLLQQYSVNKFFDIGDEMYSVNGAPGTGKTTLLKHIFANIIFEKSKAMYKVKDTLFIDPIVLDTFIQKHSIVVASTTNRANENIVHELPKRENFVDLANGFNYLDSLTTRRDSIGLLAVPLGKKENIEKFEKSFTAKKLIKLQEKRSSDVIFNEICNIEEKIKAELKKAFTKDYFRKIEKVDYMTYHIINKVIKNPHEIATDVQEFSFTDILSLEVITLQNKLFYLSLELLESIITEKKYEIEKIMNNGIDKEIKSLYLTIIPIISTTLASTHNFFETFDDNSLGNIFIEEAGQATPQSVIGLLFRANKIMAIGDPFQLEPIVQINEDLYYDLLTTKYAGLRNIVYFNDSAQIYFDNVNEYGKFISGQWVGAPLLVNRRNSEPMFTISNRLSYNELMVRSSSVDHVGSELTRVIDVNPCDGNTRYCSNQMQAVYNSIIKYGCDDVFIITPFIEVKNGINKFLKENNPDLYYLLRERIGTIHTFQGREAETVYIMLGKGGEDFYKDKPNLLNVAVSRAKNNLILVTNKSANEHYENMKIFYDYMFVARS